MHKGEVEAGGGVVARSDGEMQLNRNSSFSSTPPKCLDTTASLTKSGMLYMGVPDGLVLGPNGDFVNICWYSKSSWYEITMCLFFVLVPSVFYVIRPSNRTWQNAGESGRLRLRSWRRVSGIPLERSLSLSVPLCPSLSLAVPLSLSLPLSVPLSLCPSHSTRPALRRL